MAIRACSLALVSVALLAGCTAGISVPGARTQEATTAGAITSDVALVGLASPAHPTMTAELRGSDTVAGDGFGWSIAESGSVLVVGAFLHDRQAGRAYVFTRTQSGWRQAAELTGSDTRPGDDFGGSVAISGHTIVVGAGGAGATDASGEATGRVYVFSKTAAGWQQSAVLRAPQAFYGDGFGGPVAVSGSTILASEDGFGRNAGQVLVYTRSGRSWAQTAELRGSGAGSRPGADFGQDIALSNGEAIISADVGPTVYIFRRAGTGWHRAAVLDDRLPGGSTFGDAVAISGGTAAVGNWYTGRVYIYSRAVTGWRQSAMVQDPDHARSPYPEPLYDNFGAAIELAGPVLIVTAPGARPDRSGYAYLYIRTRSGWRLAARLSGRSIQGDSFGAAATASGNTAAVSEPGNADVLIFRV